MKKIVQGLMMAGGIMTLAGAAFYITAWFLSPYIYIIPHFALLVNLYQLINDLFFQQNSYVLTCKDKYKC